MKERINITIESDMLEALREISEYEGLGLSQCICDIIETSADMRNHRIRELYARDGNKCKCCGKELSLTDGDRYPKMIRINSRNGNDIENRQLVCEDCYKANLDRVTNNIIHSFEELEKRRQLLLMLTELKSESEENEVYDTHDSETDFFYFQGWLKTICDWAKNGIVPFSEVTDSTYKDCGDRPAIYDDMRELRIFDDKNYKYHPLVCDVMLACDHHDIVSDMDGMFENIGFCVVVRKDGTEDPYIRIRFRDKDYEYIVDNDGDWYMV